MHTEQDGGFWSSSRIGRAFIYSWDGLRHAATREVAFQQELVLAVAMSALCLVLPFSAFLKIELLFSHLLVLIVELLNAAIEAVADKVCQESDALIKQAKDMGSAAVLLMFTAAALLWGYAIFTLI